MWETKGTFKLYFKYSLKIPQCAPGGRPCPTFWLTYLICWNLTQTPAKTLPEAKLLPGTNGFKSRERQHRPICNVHCCPRGNSVRLDLSRGFVVPVYSQACSRLDYVHVIQKGCVVNQSSLGMGTDQATKKTSWQEFILSTLPTVVLWIQG